MSEENSSDLHVETTIATGWTNIPTVEQLSQDVKDAEIEHDRHMADVARWLENMALTGSAKPNTKSGQSSIAPKLIRKQAEWRYSSLAEPFLSTSDLFNIDPVTAGDKNRAIQNGLVLNNQFNTKLNKVAFIDELVRELVNTGTAIVKVGWESEIGEVTEIQPVYEFNVAPQESVQQIAQYYATLAQLQDTDPEQYQDYSNPGLDKALEVFRNEQQVIIFQKVSDEEITYTAEIKNQPVLEVCNGDNVILDPSCNGDYKRAEFICEKFKSSLSDLKKDGKYSNLDKINIEGASPLSSPDYVEGKDNESFNFTDKARKQFVVHTYWGTWDIDNSGIAVPIVASWVNDVIIRLEKNPYPDNKPPFVVIKYMPVRRSVFGEPDGELLEDNQKIIGAVTRGMIDLMGKSANSQTGIRKDMLDVTNLRKFKRGDDYEFNAQVDPRQGVHMHTYPEIPQSAYNMLELQNADAESLTGVKAFHSGISGQALGNTATAVRGALDAASKRELGILRRLANGIIDIGRKIISMNAVFLSDEEIVRVTADKFITVRRDDLAGNFDLRLTISTAEEDNSKAQELAFMLQTMGNNMDPSLSKMILADIARLRKMPDTAKRIEEYEPQPDPMAQEMQKTEIQLVQAQIAKEQALAMEHKTAAELNQARTQKELAQAGLNIAKGGTEKAKAEHLSSERDRTDLDYLEQESGVHQERELQKIATQHAAKMEQQDTDARNKLNEKIIDKTLQDTTLPQEEQEVLNP